MRMSGFKRVGAIAPTPKLTVWADPKPDGSPPTNWQSAFGGSAWEWEPAREQYYLHNFLVSQADLNWYNPDVVEEIMVIAAFWLDKGVDGFRMDVANFFMHDRQLRDNPERPDTISRPAGASPSDPFFSQINLYNICQPETIDLLKSLRQHLDRYPGVTTLAEISSAEDTLLASSQYVGDDKLHMAYNSSLMTDEPLTQQRLYQLIERVEDLFGDNILCWTAGTHDFPRLRSRWQQSNQIAAFNQTAFDHMLIALLACLRGSCCIYQGDELGLAQAEIPHEKMQDPFGITGYPHILGRDGSRTPMPWQADQPHGGFTSAAAEPWLPVPAGHLATAVDKQTDDDSSLLNKYRQMIGWRKRQPALRQGELTLLETAPPILGFTRQCAEQSLLCLFNISAEVAKHDVSKFDPFVVDADTGFTARCHENLIEIPAYGVFLAHLEKP